MVRCERCRDLVNSVEKEVIYIGNDTPHVKNSVAVVIREFYDEWQGCLFFDVRWLNTNHSLKTGYYAHNFELVLPKEPDWEV